MNTFNPEESISHSEARSRAIALSAAGDFETAVRYFATIEPNSRHDAEFMKRYGQALSRIGEHELGRQRLAHAVALETNDPEAHVLLGSTYGYLGQLELSRHHYEEALRLGTDMPAAHFNRSLHRLYLGDYGEGFAEYEWGRAVGCRPTRHIKPQWHGQFLGSEKTLYVWTEQGYGDTLQYMRLLKSAKQLSGAKIVFEVQPMLLPLVCDHPYADVIVAQEGHGAFRHQFDEHVALMSLPFALGWQSTADIPPFEPYIKPRFEATGDAPALGLLKVGLCWRGSTKHTSDATRSISYDDLKPILDLPGFSRQAAPGTHGAGVFVSLQKGCTLPADSPIVHADLRDWSETAAVIADLDLVITVDTAVAHLAGAMGKPVWILLAYDNDWRWMGGRADSPWYPTARLIRQPSNGDWASVIEQVKSMLQPKTLGEVSKAVNDRIVRTIMGSLESHVPLDRKADLDARAGLRKIQGKLNQIKKWSDFNQEPETFWPEEAGLV